VISCPFEKIVGDRNWNHLKGSVQLLKSLEIKDIYLGLLIVKAKAFFDIGDIYESITMFKECKRLA
jgi:hypothetical protein